MAQLAKCSTAKGTKEHEGEFGLIIGFSKNPEK
jgi:hypothetical protein